MSDPKIYSEEEIEFFLRGDRREIDKLLLTSCNSMAQAFLSFRDGEFRKHSEHEEKMFDALGTPEEVKLRRDWLVIQIDKEREAAATRKKILGSAILWSVPIVLTILLGIMQDGMRIRLAKWIAPDQASESQEKK